MLLPCYSAITVSTVTESIGATGEVTETLATLATLSGYMYASSARWGHWEQGNANAGELKAMFPLTTVVNAGHILSVGGVQYRVVRVSHPGNHHTEAVCDRM